jgi:hypothetical protein
MLPIIQFKIFRLLKCYSELLKMKIYKSIILSIIKEAKVRRELRAKEFVN